LREVTVSQLEWEIAEQPEALERALRESAAAIRAAAGHVRRARPSYAVLAARGSSDNACRYFQHLLGRICGMPAMLASSSLHTLYEADVRYRGALVVGVSQSGASPDVVSVLEAAGGPLGLTVAVTNEPDSPLARAARHVIELRAGAERSVAATKTYTTSIGVLAALAAEVAGMPSLVRELSEIPAAIERQLAGRDAPALADALEDVPRLAVLGRGANYCTAFEAALKLKELAGIAAEPASPADFLHGPIALVDRGVPVLAFAVPGPAEASIREAIVAARERGGSALVIGSAFEGEEPAAALEPVPEWLSPLVGVIPAQQLAAALASRSGADIDRPYGLMKVTTTL
jgi:glucosamine--fructose-6-phosphate aminotransferase (isomerizing)